jgi:hypothetical protein
MDPDAFFVLSVPLPGKMAAFSTVSSEPVGGSVVLTGGDPSVGAHGAGRAPFACRAPRRDAVQHACDGAPSSLIRAVITACPSFCTRSCSRSLSRLTRH